MRRRAIAVGLGLTLLGAYVVYGSRSRPLPRMPYNTIPMAPDPKWQFTCPKNWTCPDLGHPGTWRPPDEKLKIDPYENGPEEDPTVRT